jgi:hypothetical protein
MFRFAVRAENAWSALPAAGRLLLIAVAVGALLVLSVVPALAAHEAPNPFRWN